MIVTRASIIEKNQNKDSYLINIPSLNSSDKRVNASVCHIPGQSSNYEPSQSIYVAWLDNSEWIILGCVSVSDSTKILNLSVETLNATVGTLGAQFKIGNTDITLGDLVNFYRNFASKLSIGGIQQ